MTYSIQYAERAKDDLSRLGKTVAERLDHKLQEIVTKTDEFGIQPDRFLKWIQSYSVYRLRIGDYRAFIDVDREENRLDVLAVLKRDKAYR